MVLTPEDVSKVRLGDLTQHSMGNTITTGCFWNCSNLEDADNTNGCGSGYEQGL